MDDAHILTVTAAGPSHMLIYTKTADLDATGLFLIAVTSVSDLKPKKSEGVIRKIQ